MPGRRTFALVVSIAALAVAPPGASAQSGPDFPIYGKDKWLGNVNDFHEPAVHALYFNQVTPENAGKWGSAAGTTRTAAMRWTAARPELHLRPDQQFPYNFHTLLWGNQQPTWMASLPAAEQLAEIKKWFAAVAARYPDMDWVQVVNEGTWDPPDGALPKNPSPKCTSSGNYVRALGDYNDTDGTGHDWILNAFRLAQQYFPNRKLMLNDVAITGMTPATNEYVKIIQNLKRENLIDAVGIQAHAHEFKPGVPTHPRSRAGRSRRWKTSRVHKANLDRIAATGVPIQVTELDLDGVAGRRIGGRRDAVGGLPPGLPDALGAPGGRGGSRCGAGAQPNHWRNASNAPIIAHQRDAQARGALADQLRQRDRAGDPAGPELHARRRQRRTASAPSQADDWASEIGPPEPAHVHVADHRRAATALRHHAGHRRAAHRGTSGCWTSRPPTR